MMTADNKKKKEIADAMDRMQQRFENTEERITTREEDE